MTLAIAMGLARNAKQKRIKLIKDVGYLAILAIMMIKEKRKKMLNPPKKNKTPVLQCSLS